MIAGEGMMGKIGLHTVNSDSLQDLGFVYAVFPIALIYVKRLPVLSRDAGSTSCKICPDGSRQHR
jgi:hypothetical protein